MPAFAPSCSQTSVSGASPVQLISTRTRSRPSKLTSDTKKTSFVPFIPTKSHASRRKPGHVPRPPNAFLLFRSKFWEIEKDNLDERDHRNISRMAAAKWRILSQDEKDIWREQAEYQKNLHAALHPNYKYAPSTSRANDSSSRRHPVKKRQPPAVSTPSPIICCSPSPSPSTPSLSSGSSSPPPLDGFSLEPSRKYFEVDQPLDISSQVLSSGFDFGLLSHFQGDVSFGVSPEWIHLPKLPPQAIPIFDADGYVHQEPTVNPHCPKLDTWLCSGALVEGTNTTPVYPQCASDFGYIPEVPELPSSTFLWAESCSALTGFSDPWDLSTIDNYDSIPY